MNLWTRFCCVLGSTQSQRLSTGGKSPESVFPSNTWFQQVSTPHKPSQSNQPIYSHPTEQSKYFTKRRPLPLQSCLFAGGIPNPHLMSRNVWLIPNGTSIGSAVLAGLTVVVKTHAHIHTDRMTMDHAMPHDLNMKFCFISSGTDSSG